MYETVEQYREIVRSQVVLLEKSCHCRISNGDTGLCPRCGEFGIWDIASKGFIHHDGNSIYFSTVFNEWRCRVCDARPDVGVTH